MSSWYIFQWVGEGPPLSDLLKGIADIFFAFFETTVSNQNIAEIAGSRLIYGRLLNNQFDN